MLEHLTDVYDLTEWQFVFKNVDARKLHLRAGITAPVLDNEVGNHVAADIPIHQRD
jgi:hypothetical protein